MVTGKADLVVKNHGVDAVLRIRIPLRHGIGIQIPNLLQFAGKISLLRLVAVPGRYHADGAAGVNNAASFVHTFLQMFYIINKSNENSSANYTP